MPGSMASGSASIVTKPSSLQEVEVEVTEGSTTPVAPANLEIPRDVVAGWEQEAEASKPSELKCGCDTWSAYVKACASAYWGDDADEFQRSMVHTLLCPITPCL